MPYDHLIAATVMTLGVRQGQSSIARFFYTNKCVIDIAELLVRNGLYGVSRVVFL